MVYHGLRGLRIISLERQLASRPLRVLREASDASFFLPRQPIQTSEDCYQRLDFIMVTAKRVISFLETPNPRGLSSKQLLLENEDLKPVERQRRLWTGKVSYETHQQP